MPLSVEESCLDKFFLAPGSTGPILSLRITDDDMVEVLEASDLEEAARLFVSSLPPRGVLADLLAGATRPPFVNGKPDFVRILVFLCWMQVSRLRQQAKRDFRDIVEAHLQHHYHCLLYTSPSPRDS